MLIFKHVILLVGFDTHFTRESEHERRYARCRWHWQMKRRAIYIQTDESNNTREWQQTKMILSGLILSRVEETLSECQYTIRALEHALQSNSDNHLLHGTRCKSDKDKNVFSHIKRVLILLKNTHFPINALIFKYTSSSRQVAFLPPESSTLATTLYITSCLEYAWDNILFVSTTRLTCPHTSLRHKFTLHIQANFQIRVENK